MSTTIKLSLYSLAVAAIGFAAYFVASPASPLTSVSNSTQQCEQLLASAEHQQAVNQCQAQSKKVTWSHWAQGESRSAQFHFIDLFELLFSSDESQHQATDNYNQQTAL